MSRSSAQRTMTSAASTAAAGTAAAAASVRQAIASVAADERDEGGERDRIVPAREHDQRRGDEIGRERGRGDAVDLAGIGRRAVEQARHDQRRRQREAGDRVEGVRQQDRNVGFPEAGESPREAESERGDGEPSPQPEARERERRRGHHGEIDVERPEVRPCRSTPAAGVTYAPTSPRPASAGPCSSAAASVASATRPSRMKAVPGARKS